ncbi:MAG: hypothetical protein A3C85_04155 [Candidatus Doudnabacteria bacterium RIFCSPHIGHO2_02_FULL_48_21]|uniref:Ada DNA repair metal-binding domain-containing protein n=1 Tax=Candidatus Doudnabacteria bacterium RIFCSPLOWO2_02_FULL_48_13 TaxID=1817845 RepID=A0A1F5QBE5_9BACT|nr:MAG: hypothetical protein A3K05_00840 [Candidatus Doudnabacteria bacterium RIFCSPHIGHO2_01_48_18]OGE78855.1 MAG: hypothetical protein A2668_00555 [Candidatus Doudnabacteria bacterium RIFCSPHIGHO2_01_FULL_48_180]OGE91846.1 MAG: hypothetical protein A3F44_04235 [Candidatus Doudnabacteria bacterium RIFCSPHIGHO2_12_FULL_47_25]OGE94083.1 MAG: hypothetical protein A3C85_04155 [Candidatus Doudnabacteria bacterium RIFCSPHIGHO2_02_FULL_48_21]OGE98211.1 MAG: hypothetical protein A3A83_03520 [Candidatu
MSKVRGSEQKIALVIGYLLTAGLFFGLGQFYNNPKPPEITIEEPAIDLTKINDTLNTAVSQSLNENGQVAGASTDSADCTGKIKGNISSNSKIYHMPGGSFYNRTVPEMCFDSEAEARAAGFRKSQR